MIKGVPFTNQGPIWYHSEPFNFPTLRGSLLQKQENGRALGQTVIFLSSTLGCFSFKAEQAEFSRKSIGSFNAPPLPAPLAATAALV